MKRVLSTLLAVATAGALLSMGITQEAPIGSVAGRVTMAENGRPLNHALVVLTPAEDKKGQPEMPEEVADKHWNVHTKSDGTFAIGNLPAGSYSVEILAKEHSLDEKFVTVVEGHRSDLDVRLEPHERYLRLYASQQVAIPDKTISIETHGFLSKPSFALSIHKLRPESIAKLGGLQSLFAERYNDDHGEKQIDEASDLIWSGVHLVDKTDPEGAFVQKLELPGMKEGLYVVQGVADGKVAMAFLNVTNIGLVTKTNATSALCYVANIDTGKVISGAQILTLKKEGMQALGVTDDSGLCTVYNPPAESMLMAKVGDSFALCDFRSSGGGDEDAPTDPNTRIYSYADRPVYRPGDTIHLKSVIRRLYGTTYALPPKGNATVELYDADDDLLATKTVAISSHGTINVDFPTNAEAPPGVYRIDIIALGGKDQYYANLAAYRKPEFSVKVTTLKPRYVMGDQASAQIDCQYFFGGPVVGAKVHVSIYRSPDWQGMFDSSEDDSDTPAVDESDEESFSGGQLVHEVDAKTDGSGRALVPFETTPSDQTDPSFSDYRYSIQASVDEASGKSFEGSGSVPVSRGLYRLTATTDPEIVSPGDRVNLILKTEGLDTPFKPVPGRLVKVVIGTQTWTRHAVVYEPQQTLNATTGQDGTVSIPLTISKAESLSIRASTTDPGGHVVQAETYLFVEGGALAEEDKTPTVSIKLDRKRYQVGDEAKVLVTTSSPGGTALLTVESEKVTVTKLVHLEKSSQIVHLPVSQDMAPNVFVCVAYVNQRKFAEASRQLKVNRDDRILNVSVQPDRPNALPGSTVAFRVRTTDAQGKGVPADVSLGVVDESIYTIKKDTTDIVAGLFPQRANLVETNYSFAEVFLDGGDKGGGSIPVRRKFLDTASWNPEVETSAEGTAIVSVKLPDNLTSWRATAVAATDSSAAGMSSVNVRASKPLMVRLECPQFLVANDRQRLVAAITNDTGAEQDVNLQVRMSGLKNESDATQKLHLANGETRDVPLDVSAPESGDASIVAEAWASGGASDAVEGKFPILPHGRLIQSSESGVVQSAAEVQVNALASRDRKTGGLTITITPGIASGLIQSLDELVRFPYGCVEQTMSRFLPAILVTHALHDTPFRRPDLEQSTLAISQDGFQRLAKMQHEDGAWGWWVYDESDPFMTAWVLDGLKRAEKAGFERPPSIKLEKTLDWSEARLAKPFKNDSLSARLFLIYALAQYGKEDAAREALKNSKLKDADVGALALASLAAGALHETAIRDEALSNLKTLVAADKREIRDPWNDEWSEGEDDALALLALTELAPRDPLVPTLAHRIMKGRHGDGWSSTRSTAISVAALTSYISQTRESLENSSLLVKLNGKDLQNISMSPTTFASPDLILRIPVGSLADGDNKIEFQATGGTPYYAVDFRQYDVQPTLGQIMDSSGISVERNYYVMQAKQLETGELKLLPSSQPVARARTGDVIRCELTIRCDHPVQYLMVEDPIPSNCHVTDREDPADGEQWSYWWSSLVIRDDRVSLFARYMPQGVHKLSYTMRAEEEGVATAMPSTAENMYMPSQTGSGGENRMEVQR